MIPTSRRKHRTLVAAVALAIILIGTAAFAAEGKGPPQAGGTRPEPAAKSRTKAPTSKDKEFRKLVLGTWQDNYEGKRTLTLREDGTGTMIVELSGLKAKLVAPRLQFDMEWSITNGRLKKHSLGGKPATQVSMILKTMGDTVDEPILELSKDRLLLLDGDGKTKYDWRRAK